MKLATNGILLFFFIFECGGFEIIVLTLIYLIVIMN
jgi:hypothetical protein